MSLCRTCRLVADIGERGEYHRLREKCQAGWFERGPWRVLSGSTFFGIRREEYL